MTTTTTRFYVWSTRLLATALLVQVIAGCEDLEEGTGGCGNLRVSDVEVSGNVTPGASFEVSWTAHFSSVAGQPQGVADSGEFYTWVDVFFEDEGTDTEARGRSFSKRVASLALTGSREDSVSFSGLPEGDYSARVYLDVLWEANECPDKRANNRESVPFTVELGIAPPE